MHWIPVSALEKWQCTEGGPLKDSKSYLTFWSNFATKSESAKQLYSEEAVVEAAGGNLVINSYLKKPSNFAIALWKRMRKNSKNAIFLWTLLMRCPFLATFVWVLQREQVCFCEKFERKKIFFNILTKPTWPIGLDIRWLWPTMHPLFCQCALM